MHREWETRIAYFRASGLSGAKWCEKHGSGKKQVYYWHAKFKDTVAQTENPTQWLRVDMDEARDPISVIEIKVGKAASEVRPGFNQNLD